MITKKGSILSSVSALANSEAEENYILIRNIYEKPIEDNFGVYLLNIVTKKVEQKFEVKTNYTNCIKIEKSI